MASSSRPRRLPDAQRSPALSAPTSTGVDRNLGDDSGPDADADLRLGSGGDAHQDAADGARALTTQQGVVVADDQNSLTVGERGPVAMSDFVLREKLFHFDHERIPERVVHARGFGAHGVFECDESLTDVTRADPFSEVGKRTPVFVRFSTVAGSKGSMDLARDVRGFAVKFYTDEGNWDLVGNNIPVFFIQDAMKFPDLVHSVKPEPDRGFPQAQSAHDSFWDFASLVPETTHMLLWTMSDRAIPRSFRFMEGFGVHTFRFVRDDGQASFVKFRWRPLGGLQSVLWDEAVKINGADPDFHRRDLWNAITSGDHPVWELGVQVFDDELADSLPFDVLDATKLIPEEVVPFRPVGRLTLDRVVDNFFAETEQVAFCTQNVVPGIDFTNDPLLQGRNFSYLDTQLKRLGGPNFTQIPVNQPRCPVAHFQQDGHMAMANPSGRANYEPNSWSEAERGPRQDPARGYVPFAAPEEGTQRRVRPELFADHYSQARMFFHSQTPIEQQHIADAFTFELSKVRYEPIRSRMVANLRNVDEELAATIADGLGLDLPEASTPAREPIDLDPSPSLSILADPPGTFAGRRLGLLVTDGADAGLVDALRRATRSAGATVEVIAMKVGGVVLDDGTPLPADELLDGAPSVVYDAVAVVASDSEVDDLAAHPPARQFVADAVAHAKLLAFTEATAALLTAAGLTEADLDGGCTTLRRPADAKRFVAACADLRFWDRATPFAAPFGG